MLNSAQWRFVVLNYLISTVIFNIALNAGLGYLTFAGKLPVALWGAAGLGVDVITTGVFLPLFTHLILFWVIRKDVAAGKVATTPVARQDVLLARYYPRHTLLAALTTTGLSLLLVAPVVLALLHYMGVAEYSLLWASGLKAAYAALLSLFVVPLIARATLRESHLVA